MENFPNLTTARLILRQLTEEDAVQLFALRSDKTINQYLGRKPDESLSETLMFINKINKNSAPSKLKYWGISLIESAHLIGAICLYAEGVQPEDAEIGFELLNDYQGKGIMTEACKKVIDYGFQEVGLQNILASVHPNNQRSISLLKKLNFIINPESPNSNLLTFHVSRNIWHNAPKPFAE